MRLPGLITIFYFLTLLSTYGKRETILSDPKADSIIQTIITKIPSYQENIKEYKSTVYIKSIAKVRKKNELIRFLPNYLKISNRSNDYIQESINDIHYTAPDKYEHKVIAYNNTLKGSTNIDEQVLRFVYLNIFEENYLSNSIISPFQRNFKRFYKFKIDSSFMSVNHLIHKIVIVPRFHSPQLIKGYMLVDSDSFEVTELFFTGLYAQSQFETLLKIEKATSGLFYAKEANIKIKTVFYKNIIESNYTIQTRIKEITTQQKGKNKSKKYDLSDAFSYGYDHSSQKINDSLFWIQQRMNPLTPIEENIYKNTNNNLPDSTKTSRQKIKFNPSNTLIHFIDQISSPIKSDINKYMNLNYSGFINPLLFDYSHNDGVRWKQKLKLGKEFDNNKLIMTQPEIGYAFNSHEFYWKNDLSWLYSPRKRGYFNFIIGDGDRIYDNTIFDKLKNKSTQNLDSIDFKYFKEMLIETGTSYEIANGLELFCQLKYYIRTLEIKNFSQKENTFDIDQKYRTFAPMLRLSYTPKQYYRYDQRKKIYLSSRYPTLILEYERGIPDLLKSDSKYERLEFDVSQSIHLGLLRYLRYKVGYGLFTNTSFHYFAKFSHFSRRTLPTGWNDLFGCVFQVLDNRWFGSSNRYIQTHLQLQSPLLISRFIPKLSRWMVSERLYCGYLHTPTIKSYSEIGYGIGNHLFNSALFVGFRGTQFEGIGFKLSAELFNGW